MKQKDDPLTARVQSVKAQLRALQGSKPDPGSDIETPNSRLKRSNGGHEDPRRIPGPAGISPETPKPDIGRHQRRCTVCHHADRDLIERDFLRWRSAEQIAHEFELEDDSAIYRHAHAFGLFARRRLNLRCAAEHIIQGAEMAPPTGAAVLRAMRTFTQITDEGQWIETPKSVVVTHIFKTARATTEIVSAPASQNRKSRAKKSHKEYAINTQALASQRLLTATATDATSSPK